MISVFESSSSSVHQPRLPCQAGLPYLAVRDRRNGSKGEATSTSALANTSSQKDSIFSKAFFAWTTRNASTRSMPFNMTTSRFLHYQLDPKISQGTRTATSWTPVAEAKKRRTTCRRLQQAALLAWDLMSGTRKGLTIMVMATTTAPCMVAGIADLPGLRANATMTGEDLRRLMLPGSRRSGVRTGTGALLRLQMVMACHLHQHTCHADPTLSCRLIVARPYRHL